MRKKKLIKPKKQTAYFITAEYFHEIVEKTFGKQIHFYNETGIDKGSGVYEIKKLSFEYDEKECLDEFVNTDAWGMGSGVIPALLKEMIKRKVLDKGTFVIKAEDC